MRYFKHPPGRTLVVGLTVCVIVISPFLDILLVLVAILVLVLLVAPMVMVVIVVLSILVVMLGLIVDQSSLSTRSSLVIDQVLSNQVLKDPFLSINQDLKDLVLSVDSIILHPWWPTRLS